MSKHIYVIEAMFKGAADWEPVPIYGTGMSRTQAMRECRVCLRPYGVWWTKNNRLRRNKIRAAKYVRAK